MAKAWPMRVDFRLLECSIGPEHTWRLLLKKLLDALVVESFQRVHRIFPKLGCEAG
jgi:hypothetical protein